MHNWTQHVTITGTEPHNVYVTDGVYVAGAVAVSVVGVLAVLSLYAGVWRLARATSLNLLEVAQAFRAPLLAEADSNATHNELARKCGWKCVHYAAVANVNEGTLVADKKDNGGGSNSSISLVQSSRDEDSAAPSTSERKSLRWCFTLETASEDGDVEA